MSVVTTKPVVSCRAQSSRQQRERAGGERREKKKKDESTLNFIKWTLSYTVHFKTPPNKMLRFGRERFFLKTKP